MMLPGRRDARRAATLWWKESLRSIRVKAKPRDWSRRAAAMPPKPPPTTTTWTSAVETWPPILWTSKPVKDAVMMNADKTYSITHSRKCVLLGTGLMLWGGYTVVTKNVTQKRSQLFKRYSNNQRFFHLNQESGCDPQDRPIVGRLFSGSSRWFDKSVLVRTLIALRTFYNFKVAVKL